MLGLDSEFGSNCELILVPLNKRQEVTPRAYAAFYDVIITYRYPMRYLEQNQVAIQKLSEAEIQLLTDDELSFIKKKFKEQYPRYASEVEIQAIPKSLYQLHAYVQNLNNYIDAIKNNYKKSYWNKPKLSPIAFQWEDTWSLHSNKPRFSFEQYCYITLQDKTVRDLHYKVNQYILQKEKKIKLTFTKDGIRNPTEEDIINAHLQEVSIDIMAIEEYQYLANLELYALLDVHLSNPETNKIYLMVSNPNSHDAFLNFTRDMTLLEWNSRLKPNVNYVYQGMGVQIHRRERRGQTLSYGDGFFGGGILDSRTAMAYSYVTGTKEANNFSITELNKTLSEKDQLIYNPRITTLINLHGDGEFHHTRSKVPTTYDFIKHEGLQGRRFVNQPQRNLSFLVASDIPPEEVEKRVNDYQKEHSIELISTKHHAPLVDIPIGSIEKVANTQTVDNKKLVAHSFFKERQVQKRKSKEFKTVHMEMKNHKQNLKKVNLEVKEVAKENLDKNIFVEKHMDEMEKKINQKMNDMIYYIKYFEIGAKKQLPLTTNEAELNQLKQRIGFINTLLIDFKDSYQQHELPGSDDLINEVNQYIKDVYQSHANGIQGTLSDWNEKIENKRNELLLTQKKKKYNR